MASIFVFGILLIMGILLVMPGLIFAGLVVLIMRCIFREASIEVKTVIYTLTVVFCVFASLALYFWQFKKPDERYTQMQEIQDSHSLIGLSQEEVVAVMGEPRSKYNTKENKVVYIYNAGKVRIEWALGNCYTTNYYAFNIFFDYNDKVEQTEMEKKTTD